MNGKILVTYIFRLLEELLDTASKQLGALLRDVMTEIFNSIDSGYRSVH